MDSEGNPVDGYEPPSPRPEPARPPLDEPPSTPERDDDRLSKQVPIGLLFLAATLAVALVLGIVAALAFFALRP